MPIASSASCPWAPGPDPGMRIDRHTGMAAEATTQGARLPCAARPASGTTRRTLDPPSRLPTTTSGVVLSSVRPMPSHDEASQGKKNPSRFHHGGAQGFNRLQPATQLVPSPGTARQRWSASRNEATLRRRRAHGVLVRPKLSRSYRLHPQCGRLWVRMPAACTGCDPVSQPAHAPAVARTPASFRPRFAYASYAGRPPYRIKHGVQGLSAHCRAGPSMHWPVPG